MIARCAIVVLTLLASSPALAETLDAEAARRFVVGKLFEFTCFDGSRGAGRVYMTAQSLALSSSTAPKIAVASRCPERFCLAPR